MWPHPPVRDDRARRRSRSAAGRSAPPPCGMPVADEAARRRRRGRPTKIARDSHVGESWAMPVSAAPSSRSTRNTNASDHTAVRRVRHPMAMNTATYVTLPTTAASDVRGGRRSRACRRRPRPARHAGTIVTSATSEPPSHRPSTICHVRRGDSHVNWNVPARTSAPSTESPMTSAAIGTTSPKMPSAATFANARGRPCRRSA